ncbi:MAG TPA: phospholipase D-like domain-containing protein [Vicinamibacterales bacterium]|nr:phospholipase D-like domain-containing protein [Vicinamibacterales bacterium]
MTADILSLWIRRSRHVRTAAVTAALGFAIATSAGAQERLCDNAFEDCRTPILDMIRNERVGLDVSMWFMTDTRYSVEIIRRWQAGVPVRILADLRADANYPANATVRQSFIDAGIPIRHKTTTGINHWKMILYAGQSRMHFSAANFANGSYSPITPYTSYVDEAIYFTDDPAVVHSFMTKFDNLWTDTVHFANLANVTALTRSYPTYAIDPALNFPPDQDYQDRLVSALRLETQQVDAMMFRITSAKVPDELIRRVQSGIPVRLITDRRQYRNTTYFWHSYNIDRMFVAGIPIKWKEDGTDQDMHEKAVILHGRDMAVFGSSNWTASSSDTQREHNYFTTKTWFVDWLAAQFLRKWNNLRADGSAIDPPIFRNYTPGWPEMPVNMSPANGSANQGTSVTLRWEGGWWAHKYDVHFGTTNPPPLVAQDFMPGAATAGVSSQRESFNPCAPPAPFASACPSGLAAGTTYYWMIRGKTMLGDARRITGPVWSFTTAGGAAPSSGTERILADAYVRGGQYADTNFGSATELITKYSADPAYRRETFVKLDISGVQTGNTVRLRMFGKLSDTREASVTVAIYPAASTSWGETSITWNNRPAVSTTEWARVTVMGTTARWYEVDLTQRVQAERSLGRTTITIVVKKGVETQPYVSFASRTSLNPPALVVQ